MKKWVVWLPGFDDPKIVKAKNWAWKTYEGRSNRIVFEDENGKMIGIVVGDCAVFEAETSKRTLTTPA